MKADTTLAAVAIIVTIAGIIAAIVVIAAVITATSTAATGSWRNVWCISTRMRQAEADSELKLICVTIVFIDRK